MAWLRPLLLILLLLSIVQPTHAADELCFSQTEQCIRGRFRTYWEQNGGLSVFGYPIAAETNEVNPDTHQTYLTQWFERNRFELHSENAAPYDVLLGRLGNDGLLKQGRDWQTEPRENGPKPGCHWFEQTGHNICSQTETGFRTYWETNGLELDGRPGKTEDESLALFGYPITDPRMETNASGDTVLTQWFERKDFISVPLQWSSRIAALPSRHRRLLPRTRLSSGTVSVSSSASRDTE